MIETNQSARTGAQIVGDKGNGGLKSPGVEFVERSDRKSAFITVDADSRVTNDCARSQVEFVNTRSNGTQIVYLNLARDSFNFTHRSTIGARYENQNRRYSLLMWRIRGGGSISASRSTMTAEFGGTHTSAGNFRAIQPLVRINVPARLGPTRSLTDP